MNLYLLEQTTNHASRTYHACVVQASSENHARLIHPDGVVFRIGQTYDVHWLDDWAKVEDVKVTYLGIADDNYKKLVICAS
jgi:hypothetical protein